jgi:regulator of protease activity HflC (stomatin/prohibitin superfamily)
MRKQNSNPNQVNPVAVIAGLVAILLIVVAYSSIHTIQPGTVGIVIRLGAAQDNALREGVHFVIPFITEVQRLPVRTQMARVETDAATQDLQVVRAIIVINYRVEHEHAVNLFRDLGIHYLQNVIEPAIREVFNAGAAKYVAEELITQRAIVSREIREAIIERLEHRGVVIEEINITSFEFSTEFMKAIEDKVIEEQAAQRAERQVERIRFEAQQKVEAAKGEAEAILQRAQADAQALELKQQFATMELILLTAVEKWDGRTPTHLFGSPPMPVFETGGGQ